MDFVSLIIVHLGNGVLKVWEFMLISNIQEYKGISAILLRASLVCFAFYDEASGRKAAGA